VGWGWQAPAERLATQMCACVYHSRRASIPSACVKGGMGASCPGPSSITPHLASPAHHSYPTPHAALRTFIHPPTDPPTHPPTETHPSTPLHAPCLQERVAYWRLHLGFSADELRQLLGTCPRLLLYPMHQRKYGAKLRFLQGALRGAEWGAGPPCFVRGCTFRGQRNRAPAVLYFPSRCGQLVQHLPCTAASF